MRLVSSVFPLILDLGLAFQLPVLEVLPLSIIHCFLDDLTLVNFKHIPIVGTLYENPSFLLFQSYANDTALC